MTLRGSCTKKNPTDWPTSNYWVKGSCAYQCDNGTWRKIHDNCNICAINDHYEGLHR